MDHNVWSGLPGGYALIGFFRGEKTWLYNMEKAISAKGPWEALNDNTNVNWWGTLDQ